MCACVILCYVCVCVCVCVICVCQMETQRLRQKKENPSMRVKDENYSLKLFNDDLISACRQQIVGQLQLTGFNRRVVPEKSLNDLILSEDDSNIVQKVINSHKSGKVLSGQWGFHV